MNKIVIKKISKLDDKIIRNIEKKLSGNKFFIDKKINSRIEREISHLGKEKLIIDSITRLSKNIPKNKVLFLAVKLYHLNKQIYESLAKELKNDKKILNKRLSSKISKNKVHFELHNKLLKIADKHANIVKEYYKKFKLNSKNKHHHLLKIAIHKRRAENIYDSLNDRRVKTILHRLLLLKLDQVYKNLIEGSVELSKNIVALTKAIQSSNDKKVKKINNMIDYIISENIRLLRNFAFKYSYNVVHSEKFFDSKNNEFILATKKL